MTIIYSFVHPLSRLVFPIDGTLTSKVLIELGKAWPDLEVRISHIYADEDGLKLKVLESAMKDAKRKASVMATALGYTLGDAILVDYSRCEIDIYHSERTMCCYDAAPAYCGTSRLDVTPEDVESSDSVLTVWLLK